MVDAKGNVCQTISSLVACAAMVRWAVRLDVPPVVVGALQDREAADEDPKPHEYLSKVIGMAGHGPRTVVTEFSFVLRLHEGIRRKSFWFLRLRRGLSCVTLGSLTFCLKLILTRSDDISNRKPTIHIVQPT